MHTTTTCAQLIRNACELAMGDAPRISLLDSISAISFSTMLLKVYPKISSESVVSSSSLMGDCTSTTSTLSASFRYSRSFTTTSVWERMTRFAIMYPTYWITASLTAMREVEREYATSLALLHVMQHQVEAGLDREGRDRNICDEEITFEEQERDERTDAWSDVHLLELDN